MRKCVNKSCNCTKNEVFRSFRKSEQILSFLQIWWHLPQKHLTKTTFLCSVYLSQLCYYCL